MTDGFPSSFDLRVKAYLLINDVPAMDSTPLKDVVALVEDLQSVSDFTVNKKTAKKWHCFSISILLVKRLSLWLKSIKDADAAAIAQKHAVDLIVEEELNSDDMPSDWFNIFTQVKSVRSQPDLIDLLSIISQIPMPLCEEVKRQRSGPINVRDAIPERPKLAFVNFRIDGKPAKSIETLKAGVTYDLELDLRLNTWPKEAEALLLTPLSLEPKTTFDLPTFDIKKSEVVAEKDGTFKFMKRGRMIINNPQSLSARPYEFNYSADFEPFDRYGSFDVIGHRSLRLEGIDLASTPISGFKNIDQKVLEVRRQLRTVQRLGQDTVLSSLKLLAALGGISQQALSDSAFSSSMDEKAFQGELVKRLRANPMIGEELEIHPPSSSTSICSNKWERSLRTMHASTCR